MIITTILASAVVGGIFGGAAGKFLSKGVEEKKIEEKKMEEKKVEAPVVPVPGWEIPSFEEMRREEKVEKLSPDYTYYRVIGEEEYKILKKGGTITAKEDHSSCPNNTFKKKGGVYFFESKKGGMFFPWCFDTSTHVLVLKNKDMKVQETGHGRYLCQIGDKSVTMNEVTLEEYSAKDCTIYNIWTLRRRHMWGSSLDGEGIEEFLEAQVY